MGEVDILPSSVFLLFFHCQEGRSLAVSGQGCGSCRLQLEGSSPGVGRGSPSGTVSSGHPFQPCSAPAPCCGHLFSLPLDELSQYFGIARDKL